MLIMKSHIRQHRPDQHLGVIQYQMVNDAAVNDRSRISSKVTHASFQRMNRQKRNSLFLKILRSKRNAQIFKRLNKKYNRTLENWKIVLSKVIYKINFNPQFLLYWDIFQLLLLLFELAIIPFSISFHIPEPQVPLVSTITQDLQARPDPPHHLLHCRYLRQLLQRLLREGATHQ